jgi:hypothetical protein
MIFTMTELCDKTEKERDKLAYALSAIADAIEEADNNIALSLSADEKNARIVLSLIEVVDKLAGIETSSWTDRANALRSVILEAKCPIC